MVRRAIGDAAGLTIKAQIRQATVHLGYGADAWRVREALYGRAGSWNPGALDDLRRRFAAWQQQASVNAGPGEAVHFTLAQRLDAIRAGLAELARRVDDLVAAVVGGAP